MARGGRRPYGLGRSLPAYGGTTSGGQSRAVFADAIGGVTPPTPTPGILDGTAANSGMIAVLAF